MSPLGTKICRFALFDGLGLIFMGALSLIWGAIQRDLLNVFVGLALVTVGGVELQGRALVKKGNPRATGWLVASQMALMAVILAYCLRNMAHPPIWTLDQLPPEMVFALQNSPGASEIDLAEMLPSILKLTYSVLMLVSVVYQGSMAFFYLRKTPIALSLPPPLPI